MLKHLIMLFRTFPVQLYATSLTYYTLLAIVPILAFWLWLLESLHIDALFHTVMHGFLDPMGDIGETVGSTLFDFVHNTHSGFLHHFTLLFFFLSIFILINKLDNALNAIWGLSSNLDKKYLRDWGYWRYLSCSVPHYSCSLKLLPITRQSWRRKSSAMFLASSY